MKTFNLTAALCLLSTLLFSQIAFEPGYIIQLDGQRIDCLIRNGDWKYNPDKITYRMSETSALIEVSPRDIDGFGVKDAQSYYRSAKTGIDRSSELLDKLGTKMTATLKTEYLFLKVIVEGSANLFYYRAREMERYFFQVDGGDIKQLIYKKYRTEDRIMRENNRFRQQLKNELNCNGAQDAEDLSYSRKALEKYFKEYHYCMGQKMVVHNKNVAKGKFQISITAGAMATNTSVSLNGFYGFVHKTNNSPAYTAGVELEYVLPFNRNKWSLFTNPSFVSYRTDFEIAPQEYSSFNAMPGTLEHQTIEIPIGIRHYFYLNDQSSIFLQGAFVLDLPIKSSANISILRIEEQFNDKESTEDFTLGAGFQFNKFSLEGRYYTGRYLLTKSDKRWNFDMQSIALIAGFRI